MAGQGQPKHLNACFLNMILPTICGLFQFDNFENNSCRRKYLTDLSARFTSFIDLHSIDVSFSILIIFRIFLFFHQQESANTGVHASNSQTWTQLIRRWKLEHKWLSNTSMTSSWIVQSYCEPHALEFNLKRFLRLPVTGRTKSYRDLAVQTRIRIELWILAYLHQTIFTIELTLWHVQGTPYSKQQLLYERTIMSSLIQIWVEQIFMAINLGVFHVKNLTLENFAIVKR